jgi:4-amino-4-deoxy-L-arabinose transferase-like glycosyltransferase
MPPTSLLLAVLVGLTLLLVGRRMPTSWADAPTWREGPVVPLIAGVLTVGLTTWIWGGLQPEPTWHDEAAYRLQAELLAHFRLARPGVAVPAAFTQAAVLVTPVVAPKMLPGHALLLVPGIWLQLPGLVPVLLAGATAAMLVVLSRRVAGPGVALMAFGIWTTQAGQQRWRASYMSESTTALCWLVGWWCLLEWRAQRQTRWLLALATVTGLGAITRPLTMLVFALPVGLIVLYDTLRYQQWRPLLAALALGSLCLAVVPLQNRVTLGSWRASPLALYTAQYMPFDRLGFGLDSTPAMLALTPDLDRAMGQFRLRHQEHTPARLPGILWQRLQALGTSLFFGWRIVLVPAALVGLAVLPLVGWIGCASAALLLLAYLGYAHEANWTAYYVEAMPVAAFVVAFGAAAVLRRVTRTPLLPPTVAAGACIVLLAVATPELLWGRHFAAARQAPVRRFTGAVSAAGAAGGLVFIRYGVDDDPHVSLVRNVADPEAAAVITVHELDPATNRAVAASMPSRAVWRYTVATGVIERWAP